VWTSEDPFTIAEFRKHYQRLVPDWTPPAELEDDLTADVVDVLPPAGPCSVCDQTGWVEAPNRDGVVPCSCGHGARARPLHLTLATTAPTERTGDTGVSRPWVREGITFAEWWQRQRERAS
jgi:hypothetical protein